MAEWPVTVPPTAPALGMSPGFSEASEGWGVRVQWYSLTSVQACYAQLFTHPIPRLGMRPRPLLTDGWTDCQKTSTPEVPHAEGAFSLTHSLSSQGSGRAAQSRGEAKCALPPGKESPSQPGELGVFPLSCSVSL